MGFLSSLFGIKRCPVCDTRGARKAGSRIRCPNPSCENFDPSVGRKDSPRRNDFHPQNPLGIRYRNFQGKEKTFNAEKASLRRKRNHILARVVPTGEEIALSRDRILNLSEVESAVPPLRETAAAPQGRDLQVLNYHKKHGTMSQLYEQIRAKYPNW